MSPLLSRQVWEFAETKISASLSRITGPAELNEMVQYLSICAISKPVWHDWPSCTTGTSSSRFQPQSAPRSCALQSSDNDADVTKLRLVRNPPSTVLSLCLKPLVFLQSDAWRWSPHLSCLSTSLFYPKVPAVWDTVLSLDRLRVRNQLSQQAEGLSQYGHRFYLLRSVAPPFIISDCSYN